MDRIEPWIRRRMAAAVAAGHGEWVDAPAGELGKPIYRGTDGSVTFLLSQSGFAYDGAAQSFECRYEDAILEYPLLSEIVPRGSDMSRTISLGVVRRSFQDRFEMRFPLWLYCAVAAALPRIVDDFSDRSE